MVFGFVAPKHLQHFANETTEHERLPVAQRAATSELSRSVSRRNCVLSHDSIVKSGLSANRRLAVCFASWLAVLLVGDHQVGKTKAGASGVIALECSDCLRGLSQQAISIAEVTIKEGQSGRERLPF